MTTAGGSSTVPITSRVETSRHALTAMVFAVLGVLGLFIVGPILALVFAGKARRHLEEEPGRPGGELAASAKTVAIIALILQAAVVLFGLLFAVIVAVTANDAVTSVTRSTGAIVTPADAGRAFSTLCTKDLRGDSGGCGCALLGVHEQGITDAKLALDVTEYRTTQVLPEEIAVHLRACGVLNN